MLGMPLHRLLASIDAACKGTRLLNRTTGKSFEREQELIPVFSKSSSKVCVDERLHRILIVGLLHAFALHIIAMGWMHEWHPNKSHHEKRGSGAVWISHLKYCNRAGEGGGGGGGGGLWIDQACLLPPMQLKHTLLLLPVTCSIYAAIL